MNKIDQMKIALYYELLKKDKTLYMVASDNILMEVLFDDPAIQKMFLQTLGDELDEPLNLEIFEHVPVEVAEDYIVGYKGIVTYDEPKIDPCLNSPPIILKEDIVDVTDNMIVATIPEDIMNIPDPLERDLTKFLWAVQERKKELKAMV